MSKQRIHSGYKSSRVLADILRGLSPRKIFCVTGKSSYRLCGAEEYLGDILREYGYVRFSEYGVYPRIEDIEKGVGVFRNEQCDLVVGIGGGTALDVAKSISLLGEKAGYFFIL